MKSEEQIRKEIIAEILFMPDNLSKYQIAEQLKRNGRTEEFIVVWTK